MRVMLSVLLVAGVAPAAVTLPRTAMVCGDVMQSTPLRDAPVSVRSLVAAPADSSLIALFESGQAFPEFLEATRRRREGWHRISDSVSIADSTVVRARAVPGTWRLLVVAVDACGDSMQQVPYVARLAALVESLSVRIVLPADGATVQGSHRALDGRRATPTYVLLDQSGRDVGCIVELPRAIREWTHAQRDSLSSDALHEYRADWYTADRGASIAAEIVELMERAHAGEPVCERGGVAS